MTFADVAAATELTRPALYRRWPTQYDFWVDLTRYLAYEVDYSQPEAAMPWNAPQVAEMGARPDRLAADEVDAAMAPRLNFVHDLVCDDIRVLIRAGALGYPDVVDVGEARQLIEATRLRRLGVDIAESMTRMGRDFASPHANSDIAASMWCVADGLSVLNHFVPDLCGAQTSVDFGHGPEDWSMFGLAGRALYFGFSRPQSIDMPTLPSQLPTSARLEQPWTNEHIAVLDAAARIFIASITDPGVIGDGPNVLGYVTVARVAALAGVSLRTIYNVWPSRDDMMIDLLDDLLDERLTIYRRAWKTTDRSRCRLRSATAAVLGPPGTAGSVDPLLAFKIEPGNAAYRDAITRTQRRLVSEVAAHIGQHLASNRRQPRPEVTLDHLALIWTCLTEGARRLRRTSPSVFVDVEAVAATVVHELTVDA
ncbi:MAG: hypothetical protein CL424_00820 [Acidimicrobiaceae bacterium]|nr:hypothetical protein [Acidimicrobiaceae bacterium]